MIVVIIIIIIIVLIKLIKLKLIKLNFSISNLQPSIFCPVVTAPNFRTVIDPINDIKLQPIGCFTNITNLFFTSCVNPYSSEKITDSGINISNYPNDVTKIIRTVINNGYDIYGNKILNKYKGTDYSNLLLTELAILGYLCGYRYMSISSINPTSKNIFYSYSPPMGDLVSDKDISQPDLKNYTLTPKLNNYTNETNTTPQSELSCGYPCLQNGNPQSFNENNETLQYMCGSSSYPNIKTPPRYSVYKIFEKT